MILLETKTLYRKIIAAEALILTKAPLMKGENRKRLDI